MSGVVGPRGIYSIGAVSRMLGLSQPTIRSWEDRYGLVVAERSDGGRRIYTRDHLEQLRFIKERLDEGLSAADAHRLLAEHRAGGPPVEQRAPSGAPANAPSNAPPRLLVLLAESDKHAAERGEFLLRAEGYDVETAFTAEDAEATFATRDPALSIVELMISGGVGRELCARLKSRRDTPLLCISSLDVREQAMAAGADAFLRKPIEAPQLVSTVKDLLGHSALVRENGGR